MNFTIRKNTPAHPFTQHWKFCVGSGHAKLAQRTDWTEQLAFIHRELGIERVRFHGIFNDDMQTSTDLSWMVPSPISDRFREQSFQQIGLAYDNVLRAGMKPFVELGFMPKRLASGEDTLRFYYGGNITMPKDMIAWEQYIQDFIRYLQHRYGAEEVRTWFFEVWNEPDLGFFAGSQADYFRLYAHTARAIKAVDAAIRVGGPATSGSKWVPEFTAYCQENDVPLDFVSTHQYAGDPLTGVSENTPVLTPEEQQKAMEEYGRQVMARMEAVTDKTYLNGWRAVMPDQSEVEDLRSDVFRRNSAAVRAQAGNLPLYYTEWNANAIFGSATIDTRKTAAYDVKAILDTEGGMDGSSIWCFSDIFEEQHYFAPEFHGGFGMLTHSGVPKPLFYGLKMLTQVGPHRLELGEDATEGEIGIAAFCGESGMQILLFRQKMKNLPLPKETADITVELDVAPKSVTVQKIDADHANPYELWQQMGSPQDLNRAEAADLIERSRMREELLDAVFADGMLHLNAALGVNDLWLIKLEL